MDRAGTTMSDTILDAMPDTTRTTRWRPHWTPARHHTGHEPGAKQDRIPEAIRRVRGYTHQMRNETGR